MRVNFPDLLDKELISQLNQLQTLEVLSEFVWRLQGQSIDQNNRFQRDMRVFAQESIHTRHNLLQILNSIPIIDFRITLEVFQKPGYNLILENRLGSRELFENLIGLWLARWSLQVTDKNVLNNLEGYIKAFDRIHPLLSTFLIVML